jgi:hypothetical protein
MGLGECSCGDYQVWGVLWRAQMLIWMICRVFTKVPDLLTQPPVAVDSWGELENALGASIYQLV